MQDPASAKTAAIRLAAEGARVAVLSRTPEEIEKTCAEIRSDGGEAIALTADTSDEAARRDAVDELLRRFGGIDIVVANAGINGGRAPMDGLKPQE